MPELEGGTEMMVSSLTHRRQITVDALDTELRLHRLS
jgi:hypothetical protein